MVNIKKKLIELSHRTEQVVLFQNHEIKTVLKGIGRVPGNFDAQLLEFLKFTNGAAILDYCFMGFKNTKLGTDLDKFIRELWPSNDMLAFQFVAFMGTSSNEVFGYLSNVVDSNGNHPIAYNSSDHPERISVIGSSFENFMNTFLNDIEDTLNSHPGEFLLGIDKDGWPTSIEHWFASDDNLRKMYNNGTLENFFNKNMPQAIWY